MDYDNFFDSYLCSLKAEGRYRVFINLERIVGAAPKALWHHDNTVDEVVVWCSNDYLALSQNPQVVDAMVSAAKIYGAGSGGTRNISGTANPHVLLEQAIADFHGKEAGLIFSSGYVANDTSICTLATSLPGCVVLSDEKNHASMIQGIRNSRAEKFIFRHNDMADLESKLQQIPLSKPKLIVFTAVYSMDGDMAPAVEIFALAKKYNALTFIDEVHAVGLYGATGAGVSELLGLQDQIDIIQGNFAKGFGVVGGYISGKRNLVDFVRSAASGFIFTTSMPPANAAAILRSMELVRDGQGLRDQFWQQVNYFKQQIAKTNLPYRETQGHIIPVVVGDAALCKEICDRLLYEDKIYIQPINYPTVPVGQERLRITITPAHTHEHIDQLLTALQRVYKDYQLSQAA
ncbi:5-aminolevulinate synthase [Candidatus Odyssella acanthamoebae]|uniref:5-aminolevulinate synthase n=1 Tax=Candidatus Odyssella acanthamoebae TaxID=91604 RepID=A0A077B1T2_9PROT|nr:5-aminolevulinate synthase [Candidatus Paracaedibacter acanthamoebae]AIK96905.1 5-aminolevulinate synthase [Candidatus Paracaedibacter acanthamoebae]